MELHINRTFAKWLEMVDYCGDEMAIHKLRDIKILVIDEQNNEYRDLWVSLLQGRTECRLVEIVFDDLLNNNARCLIKV